ncbi:MAG: hypothetical protein ACTSU7_01295, partial [Candidatus Heimdallarchaeaceae archaeon]
MSIILLDQISLMKMKIDKTYKITLIGDGAVGKTSIRRSYLGETFKGNYNLTLGSDFATKTMQVGDLNTNMIIWDLAGQP